MLRSGFATNLLALGVNSVCTHEPGCTHLKSPPMSCLGAVCSGVTHHYPLLGRDELALTRSMVALLLEGCFKKPDLALLVFSLSFSLVPHSGLSLMMDTSQ